MNPMQFETMMNRRTLPPEQQLLCEMSEVISEHTGCIRTLLNVVQRSVNRSADYRMQYTGLHQILKPK